MLKAVLWLAAVVIVGFVLLNQGWLDGKWDELHGRGPYGTWVGRLHVRRVVPNDPYGAGGHTETLPDVALYLEVEPTMFSYLTRTGVRAEFADVRGRLQPVDVLDSYDSWAIPAGGIAGLTDAYPDQKLYGHWNVRESPFELTFDGRWAVKTGAQATLTGSYRLMGEMQRGSRQSFEALRSGLKAMHSRGKGATP